MLSLFGSGLLGLYVTGRHGATSAVAWVAMEQPDWATQIGTKIAGEIRRHRLSKGMSAQDLSDACTEVGMPIPRTVISNIENGRRTNVSVAELLVLARALDVPPVVLVFPVGYEEQSEFLPGKTSGTLRAIDWFSGERLAPGQRGDVWPPGSGILENWPIYMYRHHRWLEARIRRLRKDAFEYETMFREGGKEASEVIGARQMADVFISHLSALRETMARRGLLLPEIPDVYQKQINELRQARLAMPQDEYEPSTGWGPAAEWPEEPPF